MWPIGEEMTKSTADEARSSPPIRGAALWRRFDAMMLRLDRAVEALIPTRYNPFAQTGAIATTAFIVAAVTGVALLIWYRPSVHLAYGSVMAMEQAPWTGGFLRSLHRYSSDVCIFFAFIHALRLFWAGRFTGARWLAWVSGVLLLGLLWIIGWSGYMLVWDQPAQLVAEGSARFLDLVPIFSEPVSRAFLADALVPSLLFFVVFFTHMLLPLMMAVGIWLHVGRVQRARVLTSKWMGIWSVGAMVLLSLIFPATAGEAADLGMRPESLSIDAWYLAPLWLTDRMTSGMMWAFIGIGTALAVTAPWWMGRGKTRVATVNTTRCNGCTLCARDCPYDAIVMVPRTDGRRYELEARIDPKKCVGCGICAGACDSAGIGLDWLPAQATRKQIDGWIKKFIDESEDSTGPAIAFLCGESAGARFVVDGETGDCPELPGYKVVAIPCAGWVQPLSVERALRKGASGVLIVGCSDAEPQYREGNRWTSMRLQGHRKPSLRQDMVDTWRVRHITYDRTRPQALIEEAARFGELVRNSKEAPAQAGENNDKEMTGRHIAGGVLVAAAISAVVAVGSVFPYSGPPAEAPQLVVSVKHHGQLEEDCRPMTDEERARRPIHMQTENVCERGRADVRIEVEVDGQVIHGATHAPRGISGDGPAVTLDRLDVEAGERTVVVRIADGADGAWSFEESWELSFERGERQVILFDTTYDFRHFGPGG